MNIFKVMLSAVYPDLCIGCGEIIDDGEFLCDYCFEMSPKCTADKICRKCGTGKRNCECSRNAFHFDGCVAAFFNEGIAKKAMYSFKFRHNEAAASFFADQMALMVKQCYYGIDFDIITYVPLKFRNRLKRGYNQSYILAKRISEITGIALGTDVLKCKGRKNTQHKLSRRERMENIKGIYRCTTSLEGKKVLLVDDIKTTGATLNECSKQLMAAGADCVYCIAGLITEKKKKKGS